MPSPTPTPIPTLLDAGANGIPWGIIISNLIAALALGLAGLVFLRQQSNEKDRKRIRLRVKVYSSMPDPNGPRAAVIECVNLKDFAVPVRAAWLEQNNRMVFPPIGSAIGIVSAIGFRGQGRIPGTIPALDTAVTLGIEESALHNKRIDPYEPVIGVVVTGVEERFESEPTVLGKRKTGGFEDLYMRRADEWLELPKPPRSHLRGPRHLRGPSES
jgi:hypothetical protein